jgi:hypothetical protein
MVLTVKESQKVVVTLPTMIHDRVSSFGLAGETKD